MCSEWDVQTQPQNIHTLNDTFFNFSLNIWDNLAFVKWDSISHNRVSLDESLLNAAHNKLLVGRDEALEAEGQIGVGFHQDSIYVSD